MSDPPSNASTLLMSEHAALVSRSLKAKLALLKRSEARLLFVCVRLFVQNLKWHSVYTMQYYFTRNMLVKTLALDC